MDTNNRFAMIAAIADSISRLLSERARRKQRKFWEKELAHTARMCDSQRAQIARERLAEL